MRCSNCVLEDLPGLIDLDQAGVCNQCRSHTKLSYRGEEELLRQIGSSRSGRSEYDCAVMLSGGRDSTYALLKMVKDHGLKVLAINYQNPMTHPLAKENIEKAVTTLGVELESLDPLTMVRAGPEGQPGFPVLTMSMVVLAIVTVAVYIIPVMSTR